MFQTCLISRINLRFMFMTSFVPRGEQRGRFAPDGTLRGAEKKGKRKKEEKEKGEKKKKKNREKENMGEARNVSKTIKWSILAAAPLFT